MTNVIEILIQLQVSLQKGHIILIAIFSFFLQSCPPGGSTNKQNRSLESCIIPRSGRAGYGGCDTGGRSLCPSLEQPAANGFKKELNLPNSYPPLCLTQTWIYIVDSIWAGVNQSCNCQELSNEMRRGLFRLLLVTCSGLAS